MNWTKADIPNLENKLAIVTGGSSGIGFETAKGLASKGAKVILAVRNLNKGEIARKSIIEEFPFADVELMQLDLSDLRSIKEFADKFLEKHEHLDLLINNAGVFCPPHKFTKDGFELQFGTNYLGHFALTGQILRVLLATSESRVVNISSIATRSGKIYFDNLDGKKGYHRMKYYRQSKLANLLFAVELNNRLKKAGASTISLACHPGVTVTNLASMGSGKKSSFLVRMIFKMVGQPTEMGALPTLFAAIEPSLKGGEYIGPDGKVNKKGYPAISDEVNILFNKDVAQRLWDVSEKLTGIVFPL
jgi:NAD(P)-dependent dehydrogenase (short-subunit alcohol dehydrogenase family)